MVPGGCRWAEDHVVLACRIAEGLRHGGSAALTQAGLTACDVIVLDRDLPGVARRPGVPHARRGQRPDLDAHRGRRPARHTVIIHGRDPTAEYRAPRYGRFRYRVVLTGQDSC